ncbi:MAG: hypothetical protein LUE12_03530 [Ruminococcus sp.]|nr:hypothetical protein [Ruminococcus sp.]
MQTKTSDDYICLRNWIEDNISGDDKILYGVSALEYLQLFTGYVGESTIEVYSLFQGKSKNVIYKLVDSFEQIDFEKCGNLLCSTVNQAINDLLEDENADELVLTEALSNYYYSHNESVARLKIKPSNMEKFSHYMSWAIRYFDM